MEFYLYLILLLAVTACQVTGQGMFVIELNIFSITNHFTIFMTIKNFCKIVCCINFTIYYYTIKEIDAIN